MRYLLILIAVLSGCRSHRALDKPRPELSEADKNLLRQTSRFFIRSNAGSTKTAALSATEISRLRTGDVLLRRGFGAVSEFISDFLGEPYPVTHCGLLIVHRSDSVQVLHTLSDEDHDGIFYQPLADFLKESKENTLAVVRLKVSESEKRQVLSEIERLRTKNIPFDMGFDDSDTTKMYCAELKRYVFRQVLGKDIMPDRARRMKIDVIRMSNFFNPEYFELVFNQNPL